MQACSEGAAYTVDFNGSAAGGTQFQFDIDQPTTVEASFAGEKLLTQL